MRLRSRALRRAVGSVGVAVTALAPAASGLQSASAAVAARTSGASAPAVVSSADSALGDYAVLRVALDWFYRKLRGAVALLFRIPIAAAVVALFVGWAAWAAFNNKCFRVGFTW